MVANLHCPNFWGFEKLYWDLIRNTPDWMKRPGFKIGNAYGCFPGMIWNGGRPQNPNKINKKELVKTVEREIVGYEKLGIKIELTCNNISLLEEDYLDPYCNTIAKIWEKHNLTVIVAQKGLAEYLKEKYPNLKLKKSCVAWELNNPAFEYDYAVLDQFQGNNETWLLKIAPETRKKIELVANVECADGCPNFNKHHKAMSDLQRFGETKMTFTCPLMKHFAIALPMYHAKRAKHYISPERALELECLGYSDFKLVSRCYIGQAINSIIDYYIKPEFKDDAIARAYQCFGVPRRISEPMTYDFITGGELDNDTRKFLQIW